MIFVNSNGGQLCNKIWSYVSIIAYSKFYSKQLIILDFKEYKHYFPNLSNNSLVKTLPFGLHGKLYKKIFSLVKRYKLCTSFDYYVKPGVFTEVSGWDYRFDLKYLDAETRSFVKTLFSPSILTIKKCNDLINEKKGEYDFIVGVHMRRGDYKEFADGIYYYSDENFLAFMVRMQSLLNKKTCFLLCSNEKINIEAFSELNTFQIDDANAVDDLYALSLCDYIMGPHSTYTLWASFYGGARLKLIDHRDEIFDLHDFKIFLDD